MYETALLRLWTGMQDLDPWEKEKIIWTVKLSQLSASHLPLPQGGVSLAEQVVSAEEDRSWGLRHGQSSGDKTTSLCASAPGLPLPWGSLSPWGCMVCVRVEGGELPGRPAEHSQQEGAELNWRLPGVGRLERYWKTLEFSQPGARTPVTPSRALVWEEG